MKTAKQWSDEWQKKDFHMPLEKQFEAAQLDAFKAGAEWAAEMVFNFPTQSLPQSAKMADATKAILSASSSLKEIPK